MTTYLVLVYYVNLLQWMREHLSLFITEEEMDFNWLGKDKIDSAQNCIILAANIHTDWDEYLCGVDPYVAALDYSRAYR